MAKKQAPPGLADELRAAVKGDGRSLTQLAEACGVDSGRLSRFMRGERDLTVTAAGALCRTLGLRLAKD